MTLRLKLTLIAAGLTLLGVALALTLSYVALVRLRVNYLDGDNALLAGLILEEALGHPENRAPPEVERFLVRDSGVSVARIYRGGELVWSAGVLPAPQHLDRLGLEHPDPTRSVGIWRVYTVRRGDLAVQVARRLSALQATFHPYVEVAVALSLGLSLLAGGFAWALSGLALRPLRRLTRAADGFGGPTDAPVPLTPGSDEAAVLARSFSALLGRLAGQRERERRFLAYAAHELRTPISALRASLEAATLRDPRTGKQTDTRVGGQADRRADVRADRVWLGRLHKEALRLERFAQNLLALSRAETGELRRETVNLAELAGSAYDRFQPLALEAAHELVLDDRAAPVQADPRLLEQALNNLVVNALRHTARGCVTVRSGVAPAGAFLEVADEGGGFPERPNEGLGLRVVREVAAAHGGRLEVSGRGGESGARVRLWLPPSPVSA